MIGVSGDLFPAGVVNSLTLVSRITVRHMLASFVMWKLVAL